MSTGTTSNEAVHREIKRWGECVNKQHLPLLKLKLTIFTFYKLSSSLLRTYATAGRPLGYVAAQVAKLVREGSPIVLHHLDDDAYMEEKRMRAAAARREVQIQAGMKSRKGKFRKLLKYPKAGGSKVWMAISRQRTFGKRRGTLRTVASASRSAARSSAWLAAIKSGEKKFAFPMRRKPLQFAGGRDPKHIIAETDEAETDGFYNNDKIDGVFVMHRPGTAAEKKGDDSENQKTKSGAERAEMSGCEKPANWASFTKRQRDLWHAKQNRPANWGEMSKRERGNWRLQRHRKKSPGTKEKESGEDDQKRSKPMKKLAKESEVIKGGRKLGKEAKAKATSMKGRERSKGVAKAKAKPKTRKKESKGAGGKKK